MASISACLRRRRGCVTGIGLSDGETLRDGMARGVGRSKPLFRALRCIYRPCARRLRLGNLPEACWGRMDEYVGK